MITDKQIEDLIDVKSYLQDMTEYINSIIAMRYDNKLIKEHLKDIKNINKNIQDILNNLTIK